MINNKILITLLSIAFMMIIYVANQFLFLSILINPQQSQYAIIDQNFIGYLISNDVNYVENAKKIDKEVNSCVIFKDDETLKAVYTSECLSEQVENFPTLISSSQRDLGINTISYEDTYEYLYNVNELKYIGNIEDVEFPRYTQIFSQSELDLQRYLSDNQNFAPISPLYNKYSTEHILNDFYNQIIVLIMSSIVIIIVFILQYVTVKRKTYYIFKLLGLNNKQLAIKAYLDILYMVVIAYIIGLITYWIITFLNGKLFYLKMYFEYFNLKIMLLMWLAVITIVSIMIGIYYLVLIRSDND